MNRQYRQQDRETQALECRPLRKAGSPPERNSTRTDCVHDTPDPQHKSQYSASASWLCVEGILKEIE